MCNGRGIENKIVHDLFVAERRYGYNNSDNDNDERDCQCHGWRILLIAMGLLVVIFTLTELALHLLPDYKFIRFIRESFIILGWVALWRPLDLLLYDWYPIKKNINLYYRLEHSDVQVISN